jgi:hypothetical protein
MSCSASSWRLYPKRSITSHSICGSGRLFPGFKRETRRAESMTGLVTELVVAKDNEQSRTLGRISRPIQMSREYCIKCTKVKAICKICLYSRSNGQEWCKMSMLRLSTANAYTIADAKKTLPPAPRLTLQATRFTASGQAWVDSWDRQRHGFSHPCAPPKSVPL